MRQGFEPAGPRPSLSAFLRVPPTFGREVRRAGSSPQVSFAILTLVLTTRWLAGCLSDVGSGTLGILHFIYPRAGSARPRSLARVRISQLSSSRPLMDTCVTLRVRANTLVKQPSSLLLPAYFCTPMPNRRCMVTSSERPSKRNIIWPFDCPGRKGPLTYKYGVCSATWHQSLTCGFIRTRLADSLR